MEESAWLGRLLEKPDSEDRVQLFGALQTADSGTLILTLPLGRVIQKRARNLAVTFHTESLNDTLVVGNRNDLSY